MTTNSARSRRFPPAAPLAAAALAAVAVVAVVPTAAPAGAGEPGDLYFPVMDEAWQRDFGTVYQYASPTVADVDRDGIPEVVIAGQDGVLRVLRADGWTLWEAPVVTPGAPGPVAVESSPTVADLDGDGRAEIVVGAGSAYAGGWRGGVVAFNADSSVRWAFADTAPVHGTPAVADVNGDGRRDVVVAGFGNRVHALDGASGAELPGWSNDGAPGVWIDDSTWGSVAAADVDGDGRAEVFVGAAATPGGPISYAGGIVARLDLEGGGVVMPWARFVGEPVNSSLALGDITGDGRPEVVSGTGAERGTADEDLVLAFDTANGADAPGWPQRTNGMTFSSPALGDVNGDDRLDVVIGTFPDGEPGAVYAFRGDGSVIWARPPNDIPTGEPSSVIAASPIIADVNGDGRQDVTIGHGWATFSLDGPTGNRLYAAVDKGNSFQNAAAVGDFGPYGWYLVNASMSGSVAAYRIPRPGRAPDWPGWRGSPLHTGRPFTDEPPCAAPPSGGGLPRATPGGATFHPVAPTRVLDTRTGFGVSALRPVGAGCAVGTALAGVAGIPGDAEAVVLNVTAVNATSPGYLTVYPCGQGAPYASNVNYVAGQVVPNAVVVPVGAGGQVCFFSYAAVDVVADVSGWYGGTSGARYTALAPSRVLDTRGGPKVPTDGVVVLDTRGAGGIPGSGVSAVALNVTVTEPDGAGFLTAYPCGPRPNASNLNFVAGQDVPNHVIVPVTGDGLVCFSPGASGTHVVVDVSGWYGPAGAGGGARFVPLPPGRVLDTRDGTGIGTRVRVPAGGELALPVLGRLGVAGNGVAAVTLNVTATDASGPGYVTVYPCGMPAPYASNLNYRPGTSVPNLVTTPVGAGGKVCFTSYADVDLLADVAGWFVA